MKKTKLFTIIIALLMGIGQTNAQETWSLEKCVQHAVDNSLNIKRSAINIKQAELTEQGAKKSRYPNLNGNGSFSYNFGRSLDFTTYEYVTQATGNNSLGLNSNVLLYNGNRINNEIKQSKIDLEASQLDMQQDVNDIALSVARAYLNILFNDEQLANAKQRLKQTQDNLAQVDKLIKAGTRPRNDRLDILANAANDQQSIVNWENTLATSYLTLKVLLQLEPTDELIIEKPTLGDIETAEALNYQMMDVYEKAINSQPFIKAGQLRQESAELAVDIARASRYPTLNANAGVNTRFSTAAVDFTTMEKVPYFDQLDNNFGQNIGVSLSVPIYNNDRAKIAIERAELAVLNTNLANIQAKQQLKTDIQQAIADAESSKLQLAASETAVEAQKAAFDNTEKRFNLGAVNTFEYSTAKNNLEQAEVNLIVAKYQYLFNLKIVDFYLGKKMDFK